MTAAELIRAELTRAARALGAPDPIEVVIDRPREAAFGDWSTNLAMVLARPMGRKPRELAQALIDRTDLGRAGVRAAEIAGPGFINFRVDPGSVARRLGDVFEAGEAFGTSNVGQGSHVVVEFVSANPTGPLHVGHGRQAAIGDAIASLLTATGWRVAREFYYNDAGVQIQNLTASVRARIAQEAGEEASDPRGRLSR